MEEVLVEYYSNEPHVSQILTGFCLLERKYAAKYKFLFVRKTDNRLAGPFVKVYYKDKRLVYDLLDGYQNLNAIHLLLADCNYYFKRSYSPEKNRLFLSGDEQMKMMPLGFNYHVSCSKHPMDPPFLKENVKAILGIEHNFYSNTYFSPKRFEEVPHYHEKKCKVLFLTRLWGPESTLSDKENAERRVINDIRISVIERLRNSNDVDFIGGVAKNQYALSRCPDLILEEKYTNRKNYLKLMHSADIAIATMGLHESNGWKLAEYIASSKAIVSEKLHYDVPGNFIPEKNYIEFENEEECLKGVLKLCKSPEDLYAMKKANNDYYRNYLDPVKVVLNTLNDVDAF